MSRRASGRQNRLAVHAYTPFLRSSRDYGLVYDEHDDASFALE
jgi:hypothetical protein